MKKFPIPLILIIVLLLTGCDANKRNNTTNDFLQETVEQTTLSPAKNQKEDITENQSANEIKNINENIKITYFDKELSTNKFTNGDEYNVQNCTKVLPNGISPIGMPSDLLSSNLSYKKIDNEHYWYNFHYANLEKKRYVFFQATDYEDFKNVDDAFLMSLQESKINENTVYIASYPNSKTGGDCYLAYYGKLGYRCILECLNLTLDEFINLISSSIN